MPRDVMLLESAQPAVVMLKPLRIAMLRELAEPKSCPQLAATFNETPQKMYYHVKSMERAGLVERTGERDVNGIKEGFYQACAKSYWLSPRLVRGMGGERAVRDQTSLAVLAGNAESQLEDVGRLSAQSSTGQHVPSLSLAVDIALPSVARRAEFLEALRTTFEALAREYSASSEHNTPDADSFRFTLSCYPKPDQEAS